MTTLFTRDDNLCQIVSSILLSLTRRRVVVVIIISIQDGDPVWWLDISNNDDGHPHNNICVSIVCMHVTRKHFLNDFFCFFHNSGTFFHFPDTAAATVVAWHRMLQFIISHSFLTTVLFSARSYCMYVVRLERKWDFILVLTFSLSKVLTFEICNFAIVC